MSHELVNPTYMFKGLSSALRVLVLFVGKCVAYCADNFIVLLLGLEEVCRVDCDPTARSRNGDVSYQ